jgi:hypothetical protein
VRVAVKILVLDHENRYPATLGLLPFEPGHPSFKSMRHRTTRCL